MLHPSFGEDLFCEVRGYNLQPLVSENPAAVARFSPLTVITANFATKAARNCCERLRLATAELLENFQASGFLTFGLRKPSAPNPRGRRG